MNCRSLSRWFTVCELMCTKLMHNLIKAIELVEVLQLHVKITIRPSGHVQLLSSITPPV